MTTGPKKARAIRRVLVIFPGALGDLMCLLPALAAIARRHPGASVELMARFELARLAAGRTVVARAHSIDAREVGELFADRSADDRRGDSLADFDRIYSFFASDDARFRARLAAATDAEVSFHPFRPEWRRPCIGGLLARDRRGRFAGECAARTDCRMISRRRRACWRESKCDSSNLVVIFPGSGSPAKNWPADKFAALASMLSKGSGILRSADSALNDKGASARWHSCVVVLGPAEMAIEPIFREAGVAVLKHLDLPTVAAIARLASAFVGNDSGVSHLAAAVGASGVVIFGPTDPARWRPLGRRQRAIDVLRREPDRFYRGRAKSPALWRNLWSASKIID